MSPPLECFVESPEISANKYLSAPDEYLLAAGHFEEGDGATVARYQHPGGKFKLAFASAYTERVFVVDRVLQGKAALGDRLTVLTNGALYYAEDGANYSKPSEIIRPNGKSEAERSYLMRFKYVEALGEYQEYGLRAALTQKPEADTAEEYLIEKFKLGLYE